MDAALGWRVMLAGDDEPYRVAPGKQSELCADDGPGFASALGDCPLIKPMPRQPP
jgi:hypothetical protein